MSNRKIFSKQELKVIKGRAQDIWNSVKDGEFSKEGLISYAAENGFTPEEARELIEEMIVPVVDSYNRDCLAHANDKSSGWVLEKISERADGMTLDEECRYKLGVLIALRSVSAEMLRAAGTDEDRDEYFNEQITDELREYEGVAFTEEMLTEINEKLAEAIVNSGIELSVAENLEYILEGEPDEAHVSGYIADMWHDETYKYVMATAACVAKKNGELPSIREDSTYQQLTLGVCQGVDIANIQARVSTGELVADEAYEILKNIASVGVAILVGLGPIAFIFATTVVVSDLAFGTLAIGFFTLILSSMITVAATAAAVGLVFFLMGDNESEYLDTICNVVAGFRRISDLTYAKIKQGVKDVAKVARERVIPKLRSMIDSVGGYVRGLVDRLRTAYHNRTSVYN